MMYRKNDKKSRTQTDKTAADITGRKIKKIDLFLFCALAVLTAGIIVFKIAGGAANRVTQTDLILSVQRDAPFDTDTLNEIKAEFERENPLLRVRLAAEKERVTPAENSAEKAPPADILLFDDSRLSELVAAEMLYPLDSFSEDDRSFKWAAPLVLSMDMLFYNIDLLQAAGFDRPPKTRDEFIKYAQAVSAGRGGARGSAFGLNAKDSLAVKRDFFSWLWAAGVPLIVDGKPRFEGKAAVDLVEFMGRLNAAGENLFEKTGRQLLSEFAKGKTAMIIAPASAISFLSDRDFKFGVTVIPASSSPGKNMLGLSGLYAGIGKTSEHHEEAWEFISFLTEKIAALSETAETVPGSFTSAFPPVSGNSRAADDPLYAKAWEIFESSDVAETLSAVPRAADFETIVREELYIFFNTGGTAQNAAAAIQKRWEALY